MGTEEAALSDSGEETREEGDGSKDMAEDGTESGERAGRPSVLMRFLADESLDAYGVLLPSLQRLRSASGDDSGLNLRSSSLREAFSLRRAAFSSLRRLAMFCNATLRSISPCS